MSNKIGFNNFKAFGSKMQHFSNKPITLIFGPNSVGKSSLLHSQLYHEYIKKLNFPQRNDFLALNTGETYFAGDSLDFGGFSNFSHKHLNNEIVFEEIFTDIYEIGNFFSDSFKDILEFEKKGVFEYVKKFIDKDNYSELIEERVSKYRIKSDKYHISAIFKKNYNQEGFYKSFIKTYNLDDNETSKKIYFDTFNNNENLSSIVYRDDGEELDYLDLYLLFILEIFDDLSFTDNSFKELSGAVGSSQFKTRIYQSLQFYKYLVSINSFKITNAINKDKNLTTHIFINDEPIFEINYSISYYKYDEIEYSFYGSDFFKLLLNYIIGPKAIGIFDNMDKSEKSGKINIYVESTNNVDLIFSNPILLDIDKFGFYKLFKNIIYKSIKLDSSNIQYFGPLRFWPERYETFLENSIKDNTNKTDKSDYSSEDLFVHLVNKNHIIFNFLKYKIKSKVLKNIFLVPILIFSKEFYKYWITHSSQLENTPILIDVFNKLTGKKKSLKDSFGSSKMWERLANSIDIQNKINYWLENDKKLKTPYNIIIEKKLIKFNIFKKIFGFKDKIVFAIKFLDKNKNTKVTTKDIGLGISQMLPLLISSISSTNRRHYIEQPELHLHPAIQMELMDEFIKSINQNKNQFMLESHSEHMLLRIMKRIRQTQNGTLEDESLRLTPEDVCLLYVDNDGEQTYIQELRLSKNGKLLDHWPNGFFEEGYKERFF